MGCGCGVSLVRGSDIAHQAGCPEWATRRAEPAIRRDVHTGQRGALNRRRSLPRSQLVDAFKFTFKINSRCGSIERLRGKLRKNGWVNGWLLRLSKHKLG